MEIANDAVKEAVEQAGTAVTGLMFVADCLEKNGDERRAAAVRVLTMEIDDQLGQLLSVVQT